MRLLILLVLLSLRSQSFSRRLSRSVKFLPVFANVQAEQFRLGHFSGVSKLHCGQLCFRIQKCLTFRLSFGDCFIFESDPRVIDQTPSDVKLSQQHYLYGISQTEDKLSCFVNQSEASRDDFSEKCQFANKIVDSTCNDWSSWVANFNRNICPGTEIFSKRNRTKTCSLPLSGGVTPINFEEQEKTPAVVETHAGGKNYSQTKKYCEDKNLRIFTDIALLTAAELPQLSQPALNTLKKGEYFINGMHFINESRFKIPDQGMGEEYLTNCPPLNVYSGSASWDCGAVLSGLLMLTNCGNKLPDVVCETWKTTKLDSITRMDEGTRDSSAVDDGGLIAYQP